MEKIGIATEERIVAPDRREAIRNAEIIVRGMFDSRMETGGVIRRITDKPFFENSAERI